MSTAQIHIERNDRQIPVDVESDDITMGFSEEGAFPLTAEEQEWAAAEFRSQNDMTAVMEFSGICVPWHDPGEERNY